MKPENLGSGFQTHLELSACCGSQQLQEAQKEKGTFVPFPYSKGAGQDLLTSAPAVLPAQIQKGQDPVAKVDAGPTPPPTHYALPPCLKFPRCQQMAHLPATGTTLVPSGSELQHCSSMGDKPLRLTLKHAESTFCNTRAGGSLVPPMLRSSGLSPESLTAQSYAELGCQVGSMRQQWMASDDTYVVVYWWPLYNHCHKRQQHRNSAAGPHHTYQTW